MGQRHGATQEHLPRLSRHDPGRSLVRDAMHHDASSIAEVTAQIRHRIIQPEPVNQFLQGHQLAVTAFVTTHADTVVVIPDVLKRCGVYDWRDRGMGWLYQCQLTNRNCISLIR